MRWSCLIETQGQCEQIFERRRRAELTFRNSDGGGAWPDNMPSGPEVRLPVAEVANSIRPCAVVTSDNYRVEIYYIARVGGRKLSYIQTYIQFIQQCHFVTWLLLCPPRHCYLQRLLRRREAAQRIYSCIYSLFCSFLI